MKPAIGLPQLNELRYPLDWRQQIKLLENNPSIECLGSGDQNIAFVFKENPNLVMAYNHFGLNGPPTHLEAKQIYLVHRILNILFPNNFPRIHAVFGISEDTRIHSLRYKLRTLLGIKISPGSVRQRIETTSSNETKITNPFSTVIDSLRQLGIPIADFNTGYDKVKKDKTVDIFDSKTANFRSDKNGNEYYLDLVMLIGKHEVRILAESLLINKNRIVWFLEKQGVSKSEIDICINSINRLANTLNIKPFK